jgi:hypothetical protein
LASNQAVGGSSPSRCTTSFLTWPIAYANATPCYIVSKLFYYGWLRPLKAVAEERVMETVSRALKKSR